MKLAHPERLAAFGIANVVKMPNKNDKWKTVRERERERNIYEYFI